MLLPRAWSSIPRAGPSTRCLACCKRYLSAGVASSSRPVRLYQPSIYVRPLGPRNASVNDDNFILHLNAFSPTECRQILTAALWKLDRADSTTRRKRRKDVQEAVERDDTDLQDLFSGPYGFEEGHFDSVIHDYRESLLSSLPPPSSAYPDLPMLMRRLYASVLPDLEPEVELPPKGTLTHLLHLAPHGQILPHVDNLDASGSVILGLSLGAPRILRLEHKDEKTGWDVLLPSGSVYLQKDSVRYEYEHSILPYDHEGSVWDGRRLEPGHRVSIMIRDTPTKPAQL